MAQSLLPAPDPAQPPAAPSGPVRGRPRRVVVVLVVVALTLLLLALLVRPQVKTSSMHAVIAKARLTDSVPLGCERSSYSCHRAALGYRILIIWLKPLGDDVFSTHETLPGGASVASATGTQVTSFYWASQASPRSVQYAFAVRDSERDFQLILPGSQPIDLNWLLFRLP